jgi:replication initiation protein RepC
MGGVYPRFAAGLRRLRPESVAAIATAERFGGLPPDVSRGQILAAFKRAVPFLGIPPRLRDAVDVLMAYSQPQDWEAGCRPIVWPSNSALQEQLGLGRRQVQYLIRALVDRRLIVPADSPTGRRWGRRHPVSGKIVEAYGLDLSPLAVRYAEFMAAAARGREDREARARLRRRLTIARKAIRQIGEAALEAGLAADINEQEGGRDWRRWAEDAAHVAEAIDVNASIEGLRRAVADLEARRLDGEAALKKAFMSEKNAPSDAADCAPITTTNERPAEKSAIRNTASEQFRTAPGNGLAAHAPESAKNEPFAQSMTQTQEMERDQVTPRFVLKISPSLKPYIVSRKPSWPDIVNAADQVRTDLGISRDAWIAACETMGRTAAAAAIAIIAAKSGEIRSAGGYLRAMTERAHEGTLHLGKSFYGLAERQRRTLA